MKLDNGIVIVGSIQNQHNQIYNRLNPLIKI